MYFYININTKNKVYNYYFINNNYKRIYFCPVTLSLWFSGYSYNDIGYWFQPGDHLTMFDRNLRRLQERRKQFLNN